MDGLVDMAHLVHIELARQYGHVGKLGVEAQGLDVGDVELGGEVDLQADLPAVAHHGHVGGNDGRDTRLARRIEYLAHRGEVVVVDDRVDREVGLDLVLGADGDDLPQVANVEVIGRMGPHVEPAHAEIDGVGTRLDGRGERLVAAHGGHDLVLFAVLVVHVLSVSGKKLFLSVSEKKPWPEGRRPFYFFVRKMIWKRLGTRIESEQSRPTTIRRSEPWKKSMSWPSAIPGRSLNIR